MVFCHDLGVFLFPLLELVVDDGGFFVGLFLELWDFLVDLVEVGEEELLAVVGLELGLFEFGRHAEQLLL